MLVLIQFPAKRSGESMTTRPLLAQHRGRRLLRSATVGRDLYQARGPVAFFGRILPWFACRRYLLFAGPLPGDHPRAPARIPLRIAPASASEMEAVLGLRPYFYTPEMLRDRLEAGHVCFTAWEGSRLVHARWAFRGQVYLRYLDRTLLIPEDKVYYDETYTAPDRRHLGVDYATLATMLDGFAKKGCRGHAFLSATWDVPLHRRAAAFGMRVSGSVGRRSVLDRRWVAEGGLRIIDEKRIRLE